MATYKVIQDIEAEDKLVGPLTLRQFIYAGIAVLSIYLGFLSATKGAAFMLIVFVPITGVCGFFAFPWGQDQPTEVWALARIRFMVKARKRLWDQTGAKELVKVTAPPVVERHLTNGLSQDEVQSRLNALASTIDSRGWAIKNVNVNMAAPETELPNIVSDRLIGPSALPPVTPVADDITAADDILDEKANPIAHKFGNMITAADANHRQQIVAQLQMPAANIPTPRQATPQPPADYWFMQSSVPTVNTPGQAVFGSDPVVSPGAPAIPGLTASSPTADEVALVKKLKAENQKSGMSAAYGHLKTLKTPEQLAEEARQAASAPVPAPAPPVTPHDQAAIINLSNNDDLDVATIARQAQAQVNNDGEVVISLR